VEESNPDVPTVRIASVSTDCRPDGRISQAAIYRMWSGLPHRRRRDGENLTFHQCTEYLLSDFLGTTVTLFEKNSHDQPTK